MPKVHFIGIGGIGMSALARYYLAEGYSVTGSDLVASDVMDALKRSGVDIYIDSGDRQQVAEDLEAVIYSAAVPAEHSELEQARGMGIRTLSYAEAVGELTKKYFTLAVAGTHGKSTTTSMLALMLIEAGLDPTVIVGARLAEFRGTNFRRGESKYLVIEADEYDRSFMYYQPQITIINNVDNDHLDTYGDINGVAEGFNQYLKNLSQDAVAVLNSQDVHTEKILTGVRCKIVFFNHKEAVYAWPLTLPGRYNQLNAEAAWQAAQLVGVERSVAEAALMKFTGIWRRLEPLEPIEPSFMRDTMFFSDYGHHPTEVSVTLEGLREKYPQKKILIIFQPHQAKRLDSVFMEFVGAFKKADAVCLLPVYQVAGREESAEHKTSQDLSTAIMDNNRKLSINQQVSYKENFEDSLALIEGGVVVFMGAGDIDTSVREHFQSKLIK
ncbi:MAG: Mur ligase domain-containing protein [Candidatus Colwellbacteria bacterium]|nr:Mur ligase domain-containing protein [Candidatus Colwellbacteria bacterium]